MSSANILLQRPACCVVPGLVMGDYNFTFSYENRKYVVGTRNGEPFFVVIFYGNLPDCLDPDEAQLFEWDTVGLDDSHQHTLQYGAVPSDFLKNDEGIYDPRNHQVVAAREIDGYRVTAGNSLTPHELTRIMESHSVLFYTGAGISKSSGVWDMEKLRENLGIDDDEEKDGFLKRAFDSPETITQAWMEFRRLACATLPTPAHKALHRLAKYQQCAILTENIDLLQERTGVRPLHISAEWFSDNVQLDWLCEIEVVVTIGLSADDRGFLGWYKGENPEGKIIAVNARQPRYIGEGDAIVMGNLQEILPQLERNLNELS